jgi:NADH dehydrogenase
MKKELIIIGGGYAGTTLIHKLKNIFNITLIDENKLHLEQTEIHRYLGDKISLENLTFTYEDFSINSFFRFIHERVSKVDFKNNYIYINNSLIKYDYLVIATGSKTFFPKQIKNLNIHKKDIKLIEVIRNFKDDFNDLLKNSKKNKNIIIAGAGLSGVEIAIELAQKIKENNIKPSEIKITLVEQQKTILPESDNFLINTTKKVLNNFDVECIHNKFITEIQENKIILSNNEEINYDLSLFVLGVSSINVKNENNIDVNIKNQYIVNEYFQIDNHSNAFCIGDAAQTLTPDGKYNLPTAQMANQQALVLSSNLKKCLKNKALIKKQLKLKGVLIDLGKNNAVGLIGNLKLNGYIAYILKRFTSYLHKIKF